jgi:Uma2 family endonuclease
MVALPDRILMSAEEYLVWEPTQEERYEYWDGEVVAMSGATRNHNRISLNFSKLLDDALADVYDGLRLRSFVQTSTV